MVFITKIFQRKEFEVFIDKKNKTEQASKQKIDDNLPKYWSPCTIPGIINEVLWYSGLDSRVSIGIFHGTDISTMGIS